MTRSRSGPSFGMLMILIGGLIAIVLVYRVMSSMPLDLVSKQSHNRVFYEQLYSEASDEVADWRQRYDEEVAIAEKQLKLITKVESEAKLLREENEDLKAELARLRDK